ncbi:MAG: DUF748 domain-containing protein [Methylobacter sp.]
MRIRDIPSSIKIAAAIVGGILGIYTALGFFLLPALIKSELPTLIRQQTGRSASVGSVRFDPFSLRLRLQGFQLQEPDGSLFAGFEDFLLDIAAMNSLGQRCLVINEVALSKPTVRIAKNQNGEFNFNDLIQHKNQPEQKSVKIFPASIEKLSIIDGKLDWEDAHFQNPATATVYPINLTVENLTTQADQSSHFNLTLVLSSGGKLDWQGGFSLNPLSSSGHIKLTGLQLPNVRALALQDIMPLGLQGDGLIEADYQADYAGDKFNLQISQGKFELHNFQLAATPQDPALVKVPGFAAHGIALNLAKHQLSIDNVNAKDADIKAWLNAEGRINYQSLLPAANTGTDTAQPQRTPWDICVGNIVLDNFGLSFEDRSLPKPVVLTAKPINFKLTDFSNKAGASLPFQFSAGFNDSGSIKLDGSAVIQPFTMQAVVNVKDIKLENFQPYVDRFAKMDIIDGALAVDGNLALAKSEQQDIEVKFTGNTVVSDLITRDQIKNKDFIKWQNLALKGIDLAWPANQYSAESLTINKPYARVVIKQDKTVNFSDIIIADKTKHPAVTKSAQPESEKPTFKLGKIEIIDGASDFSDLSLILPFSAQIRSLDGGASGISSDQKATIKVDLKGTAYDLAPVDVKGEVSPYKGDYNVKVNFTGMPMPLISSYMVQFAGYKVEKGKMSLGLNYKIVDKQLTATNNILIDQFELGEKVENPNAVSLPLELAVALMKDADGKIDLHVPITGSLEDPKFSISHLVADALINAIGKVLTSPFRMLASMIGSSADLSMVAFEPGDAVLTKQQMRKLDDLVKALKAKPELKLDIKGAAYQEQDWPAVSDDALYDQLKRIKAAEINKQGGRKIRPEYVIISDADYRRLMEQLFVEKFPAMVEKTLLGKVRLIGTKADTDTHEFYAIAKDKLSAIIKPEEQRLRNLAAERAQAIANYIVHQGGISNDRVFILDTAIDPKREGNGIVSLLSLTAD